MEKRSIEMYISTFLRVIKPMENRYSNTIFISASPSDQEDIQNYTPPLAGCAGAVRAGVVCAAPETRLESETF